MNERPLASERLKAAIKSSPDSLRRIAAATGVDVSVLSRFVRGKVGIAIRAVDALAVYFDLDLTPAKRTRKDR